MKRRLLLLSLVSLTISCNSIIKEVYGVNKNHHFETKQKYLEYINKKYQIDAKKVFLIPKDKHNEFMNMVIENKVDYFYGIYLNDSTRFAKTDKILLNQSCYGRILDEIKSSSTINRKTEKDMNLKKIDFYNLLTNEKLNLNNSETKKILLLFSVKFGRLRNKDFKEITKLIKGNEDYELKIISVDQF